MKNFRGLLCRSSVIALCAGFFILFLVSGSAGAEESDFVSFGIAGGWAGSHHADLKATPPLGEALFNSGYAGKAALGIVWNRTFHFELEYLYTAHNIDSINNPPVVTELTVSDRVTHSLILNAMFRKEVPPLGDEHWQRRGFFLYFGAGAGFSHQDYTLETVAAGSDITLSAQAMIGFEKMNPSSFLFSALPSPFLQYRFIHMTEADFGAFQADASMHILEFGFRFYGLIGD